MINEGFLNGFKNLYFGQFVVYCNDTKLVRLESMNILYNEFKPY